MPHKCFMIEPTGEKSPQGFTLYRRADTGEVAPFLNYGEKGGTPIGAMWWMTCLDQHGYKREGRYNHPPETPWRYFPDAAGRILAVRTPGGTWIIDSRCSNCTRPNDNTHRCWVRHGEPPNITIDKAGETCDAGAGSIQCGSYHGFLRNGFLTD